MKAIHLVFVLLLVLAGLTITVLIGPAPEGSTGRAHETIPAMMVGGDGLSNLMTLGHVPYYFQHVGIMLCGLFMYMGVATRRRDVRLRLIMAGLTAISMVAWHMMFSGYLVFLRTGVTEIVLGFPKPTLWFLLGLWASYLPLCAFYVIAFRRYFYSHADEADFKALVAEVKAAEGDA